MTLNMTEYREYWRSLAGTHLANGDAIEAALNDLEGGGGALLAAAQAAITHEFLAVVVMEQLNDAARRFASLREVAAWLQEPRPFPVTLHFCSLLSITSRFSLSDLRVHFRIFAAKKALGAARLVRSSYCWLHQRSSSWTKASGRPFSSKREP